jgi:hypothetical protein
MTKTQFSPEKRLVERIVRIGIVPVVNPAWGWLSIRLRTVVVALAALTNRSVDVVPVDVHALGFLTPPKVKHRFFADPRTAALPRNWPRAVAKHEPPSVNAPDLGLVVAQRADDLAGQAMLESVLLLNRQERRLVDCLEFFVATARCVLDEFLNVVHCFEREVGRTVFTIEQQDAIPIGALDVHLEKMRYSVPTEKVVKRRGLDRERLSCTHCGDPLGEH